MSNLPQLVVAGLAAGSLYALLALGLVLIYQVSGVINFAQGALATLGAYITWHLSSNAGLDFWPAAVISIGVAFLIGVLLQAALLRPLQRIPAATALIVTLGLVSLIEAALGQTWGFGSKMFLLPISFDPVRLGPIALSRLDLTTIGAALALIAGLFAYLRWTSGGMALRAVAQTRRGARLVGVRVNRVLLWAWGLSAAISAVAGVLIAGHTILSPSMADTYLLSAFAGAIIGGLDNLPGAAISALSLGVIQNLVAFYISNQWHDAVIFALFLIVLLVRPAGLFSPAVQRRV